DLGVARIDNDRANDTARDPAPAPSSVATLEEADRGARVDRGRGTRIDGKRRACCHAEAGVHPPPAECRIRALEHTATGIDSKERVRRVNGERDGRVEALRVPARVHGAPA